MKNYLLYILLFSILVPLQLQAGNKILASINGNTFITEYDIEKKFIFLNSINNQSTEYDNKNSEVYKRILNEEIINEILIKESKQFNIDISSEEIEEQIKTFADTEKKYQDIIKNAYSNGLSKSDFEIILKKQSLANKFKQTIAFSRASVSKKEIEDEVNKLINLNGKIEFEIYEIAVSTQNRSQEEIQKQLQLIIDSLNKGQSFTSVANLFSDVLSASKGGYIGWVPEDYLGTNIVTSLSKLTLSKNYTDPILSEGYYRILTVTSQRPLIRININSSEQVSQLENFVRQKILFQKSQIAFDDYLKEIMNNSSIVLY